MFYFWYAGKRRGFLHADQFDSQLDPHLGTRYVMWKKIRRPSLRSVVEAEGGGKAIRGSGSRWFLAHCVRECYRPARKMLGDTAAPSKATIGTLLMRAFIVVMEAMAERFRVEGDFLASFLALHNAASAHGMLGDKHSQNAGNRAALEYLNIFVDGGKLTKAEEAEVAFLRSKIFFGLLENDPEFATTVDVNEWDRRVWELHKYCYPDFPGRALRLAKYLEEKDLEGNILPITILLTMAEKAEFGKEDQRVECVAMGDRLVAMGHLVRLGDGGAGWVLARHREAESSGKDADEGQESEEPAPRSPIQLSTRELDRAHTTLFQDWNRVVCLFDHMIMPKHAIEDGENVVEYRDWF